MNAMKTITVRRTNNSKGIGQHVTLTTIKNDPGQIFGFAMTDEGEEVYIPAALVKAHQMTDADVGAGLTFPLRPNPRANDEANNPPWVASNPVTWDDQDPQQIEVEVEDQSDEVDTIEWDKLVTAGVEATDLIGPIDDTFQKIGTIIKGMQHLQTQLASHRDGLKKFSRQLDELAPETTD